MIFNEIFYVNIYYIFAVNRIYFKDTFSSFDERMFYQSKSLIMYYWQFSDLWLYMSKYILIINVSKYTLRKYKCVKIWVYEKNFYIKKSYVKKIK